MSEATVSYNMLMSPPSRGAWIEMPNVPLGVGVPGVAPLAGGVD